MKRATLVLRYSGFVVTVVGQNDQTFIRKWVPNVGEYEKNLFCTYVYQGLFEEFKSENNELIRKWEGEFFSNSNLVLDYLTYEMITKQSTWLCFSSYKPLEGKFVRLSGTMNIPVGVGVYCVLGTFEGDGKTAKALNYFKPREYEFEISGDAKIILIKLGQFVNVPLD